MHGFFRRGFPAIMEPLRKKGEHAVKKLTCREILIRTLCELLTRRSFDRISVQDILEETGVSRATFYKHFSCKEQLLTEAFEALWRETAGSCAPLADLYAIERAFLLLICRHECVMRRAWDTPALQRHLQNFFADKLACASQPGGLANGRRAFLVQSMTAVLMDVGRGFVSRPDLKEIDAIAGRVQRLWTAMNMGFIESDGAA